AQAPLLRKEPHGEQRHEHEQQLSHVVELVLPQAEHQVHAAEPDVEVEVGVEEPAREHQEDARQGVEQERGEVEDQLLARDREDPHDARSRPLASRRTSSRKMSSSPLRPSCAPRSAGVPSPTMRPRTMTITRSHSCSTSERMWLENSTVRLPRSPC